MALGTFLYGMRTRWGGQSPMMDLKRNSECPNCGLEGDGSTGPISLAGSDISVIRLRNAACKGRGCLSYCIRLPGNWSSTHSRTQKVIVRRDVVQRLYIRYIHCRKDPQNVAPAEDKGLIIEDAGPGTCEGEFLPGYDNPQFLNELCKAVHRKFEFRFQCEARTVSPDLYSLWWLTSRVSTELFADSFNESGVLKQYCSADEEDSVFGSVGRWEDIEENIEGAGGNPPFNKAFLNTMITEFDRGARGTVPYCRCVLLPLGKSYGLKERTQSLTSKGILLLTIPPGCLSFKPQEGFFSYCSTPREHAFQELGIFVWQNREYIEKYPPPKDVEFLYFTWVATACKKPSSVQMDLQAFERAFPEELRDTKCLAEVFSVI